MHARGRQHDPAPAALPASPSPTPPSPLGRHHLLPLGNNATPKSQPDPFSAASDRLLSFSCFLSFSTKPDRLPRRSLLFPLRLCAPSEALPVVIDDAVHHLAEFAFHDLGAREEAAEDAVEEALQCRINRICMQLCARLGLGGILYARADIPNIWQHTLPWAIPVLGLGRRV